MTLYGIAEIAQVLGVRRQTVAQWRLRGQLPPPTAKLAMGPVWQSEAIEPWLEGKAETAPCIYCGQVVVNSDVPDVTDETAWTVIAAHHAPRCDWVRTRAHRL